MILNSLRLRSKKSYIAVVSIMHNINQHIAILSNKKQECNSISVTKPFNGKK